MLPLQAEPVDAWIQAATREITVINVEALVALGRKRDLTVPVWDRPAQAGLLPHLAVLWAPAPAARARYLGTSVAPIDAVEQIEGNSDFRAAAKRLRNQLRRADIGYAAAIDASAAG